MATKVDLARRLSKKTDKLNIGESQEIIDLVFDLVEDILVDEEYLLIKGFGRFVRVETLEREGNLPGTDTKVIYPSNIKVRLKPSKIMVERVKDRVRKIESEQKV